MIFKLLRTFRGARPLKPIKRRISSLNPQPNLYSFILPSISPIRWLIGTKATCGVLIILIGYAINKKTDFLEENLDQFNQLSPEDKLKCMGELIEVAKLAPQKIIEHNWTEYLIEALGNKDLDPHLKCAIAESIKYLDFEPKFKMALIEILKKLSDKNVEEIKGNINDNKVERDKSNSVRKPKEQTDELNLFYKLGRIVKRFEKSLSKTDENSLKTILSRIPDLSKSFSRFFAKDYFTRFAYNDLKRDLMDRAYLTFGCGMIWSTSRHLLNNGGMLIINFRRTLFYSLFMGLFSSFLGIAGFFANSYLNQMYFDGLSRDLSLAMANSNFNSSFVCPLSELPSLLKTSALLFFLNRFFAPYSNVPFFLSFILLTPMVERLGGTV